jgi:hypothetical protein
MRRWAQWPSRSRAGGLSGQVARAGEASPTPLTGDAGLCDAVLTLMALMRTPSASPALFGAVRRAVTRSRALHAIK